MSDTSKVDLKKKSIALKIYEMIKYTEGEAQGSGFFLVFSIDNILSISLGDFSIVGIFPEKLLPNQYATRIKITNNCVESVEFGIKSNGAKYSPDEIIGIVNRFSKKVAEMKRIDENSRNALEVSISTIVSLLPSHLKFFRCPLSFLIFGNEQSFQRYREEVQSILSRSTDVNKVRFLIYGNSRHEVVLVVDSRGTNRNIVCFDSSFAFRKSDFLSRFKYLFNYVKFDKRHFPQAIRDSLDEVPLNLVAVQLERKNPVGDCTMWAEAFVCNAIRFFAENPELPLGDFRRLVNEPGFNLSLQRNVESKKESRNEICFVSNDVALRAIDRGIEVPLKFIKDGATRNPLLSRSKSTARLKPSTLFDSESTELSMAKDSDDTRDISTPSISNSKSNSPDKKNEKMREMEEKELDSDYESEVPGFFSDPENLASFKEADYLEGKVNRVNGMKASSKSSKSDVLINIDDDIEKTIEPDKDDKKKEKEVDLYK